MRTTTRHGLTIVELLAVVATVAVLLAAAGPLLGQARCDAMQQRSEFNLGILNRAHALYAADWDDRQLTLVRDDLGLAGGDCETYNAAFGCHPGVELGADCTGVLFGFYFGCDAGGGTCLSFPIVKPINFSGAFSHAGAFRLPNPRAFSAYVNGRFFDPVFYAPRDPVYADVQPLFGLDCEYADPDPDLVLSASYVLSPAAMFDPAVLRGPFEGGYQSPDALAAGYQSPTVSQAKHPARKSRMIEHGWLQRHPPGYDLPGGYLFNHSLQSQPVTLFYDGSIRLLSVREAIESDARFDHQNGYGLWSRDTPLGESGYLSDLAFDFAETSYHILTTDGIRGRDTLE